MQNDLRQVDAVLALLEGRPSILTGAFEGRRCGVVVNWAMRCARDPPLVCVALEKGRVVSPVIRDSRAFGLCPIRLNERVLLRKFSTQADAGDPFVAFEVQTLVSGSPILTGAAGGLDCEVVRHFDLEADHELYVGRILDARTFA